MKISREYLKRGKVAKEEISTDFLLSIEFITDDGSAFRASFGRENSLSIQSSSSISVDPRADNSILIKRRL